MVKIRLARIGRKNLPAYKIVVTPLRTKRNTKFVEELGHYQPVNKVTKINKERAAYWLSVGAKPSDTVKSILIKEKLISAPEKKKIFNKKPGKKAQERKSTEEAA